MNLPAHFAVLKNNCKNYLSQLFAMKNLVLVCAQEDLKKKEQELNENLEEIEMVEIEDKIYECEVEMLQDRFDKLEYQNALNIERLEEHAGKEEDWNNKTKECQKTIKDLCDDAQVLKSMMTSK